MKKVQILLSTYNGEKYLNEQIESLQKQIGAEINILVRDDGSTDSTTQMLSKWQEEGVLEWYEGENLGPARSFMNLLREAPNADYYAFCDQDDVWDENKILKAIENLEKTEKRNPALYFSRTQVVDENLLPIKGNKYPQRVYTFGNALIKNNCTGCTMVFNKNMLDIAIKYEPSFITMHDYWIYLLCLSVGGDVIYDVNSYIKYRQHSNNVVGGKQILVKEYYNKYRMLISRSKTRFNVANQLKLGYYNVMPYKNRAIIDKVTNYTKSMKNKWELIFDKEIRTNNLKDNMFFIVAVLFEAF